MSKPRDHKKKTKAQKPVVAGLDPVKTETDTPDNSALEVQGKAGRPTKYTPALVDDICQRIAGGESMRAICEDEAMPPRRTVLDWLAVHAEFRTKYAQARELQADALVEECLEIADDGRNDWMEKTGKDGETVGWVINGEAVSRSRIRLEQRRWWASKIAPKKYGDKLDLTTDGHRITEVILPHVPGS